MLNETTGFRNHAIRIDPDGCGCTDCLIHDSIPENQDYLITELIKAHFEEGREVLNGVSGALVLYKSTSGEYSYTTLPVSGSMPSVEVIAKESSYYSAPEDSIVIRDDYSEPDEGERTALTDDDAAVQEAIEKHFAEGEKLINRTDGTLIVYQEWSGDYGYKLIHAAGDDDPVVSIIPE